MQRLKISHTADGKGAFMAGVLVGDIIVSFGDVNVESNDDLGSAIQSSPRGGELIVNRNGKTVKLNITSLPLGVTTVPVDYDPAQYWKSELVSQQDDHVLRIEKQRALDSIIVTTTPSVDGYRVERFIDLVTAECVYGMNIFSDFFSAITDIVGGRSGVSQDLLRDARKTCVRELREEALAVGANAVIGVSLDYSELSGQGKSMLFLVASGTAVVLEKSKAEVEVG